MENEKQNEFVNFNGIDKKFVHEKNNEHGKYYSIGILVSNEMSRNGIANFNFSEKQYAAFVHESKSDAGKVNIGIPSSNETIKVSTCKYADKEDKTKNKYETKEVKVADLLSAHIEAMKARKERQEAKEQESNEPELG